MRKELTNKEFKVMCVLWNSERPLTFQELLDKLSDVSWNSINKIINKLMEEGYIKIAGAVTIKKSVNRLYTYSTTAEEYTWQQMHKIFQNTDDKSPLSPLLLYLTGNKKYNKEVKEELRAIIESIDNE